MDNTALDIEICKQCLHKDCRYCRFNHSNDTVKSSQDGAHDNVLLGLGIDGAAARSMMILLQKSEEFQDKTQCMYCPLEDECRSQPDGCTTMFLKGVLTGFIDADGNPAKKRQPQD